MGSIHAKVLRDLGYAVTTVDPNPLTGADYTTLDGLARPWQVAVVATPIEHVATVARQLAGTERLLIEKPFALNVQSGEKLALRLNARAGLTCVGFVERFNPVVRELKERLVWTHVESARFIRWNDRPSWNVDLDLRSHDVDLARHLGVLGVATFDTHAGQAGKARRIELQTNEGPLSVDLMAHDTSPLHALWHTFLMGGDVPTPDDAIAALRYLQRP
jgi:predicted dehydrogenase